MTIFFNITKILILYWLQTNIKPKTSGWTKFDERSRDMHGNTNILGKELWWESGGKDRFHDKENLSKLVKIPLTRRLVNLKVIFGLEC